MLERFDKFLDAQRSGLRSLKWGLDEGFWSFHVCVCVCVCARVCARRVSQVD